MRKITIISIFVSCTLSLIAQDNGMNNQVVIVKDAQTEIAESKKLNFQPEIKEVPIEPLEVKCNVPEKLIELPFQAQQIKPKSYTEKEKHYGKDSYIKLGFGSLLSPFAEISYNDQIKNNFTYGAYYRHFSGRQKIKDAFLSNNEGGLYLDYIIKKKVDMGLKADYDRDVHHFYGYNHEDTTFNKNDIKNTVNHFGGNIYIKNAHRNKLKFDYELTAGGEYMFTKEKNTEYAAIGSLNMTKTFLNKHFVNVHFTYDVGQTNYVTKLNRNLFLVGANYTFDNDDWSLRGGIDLAFDNGITYLFPDIYSEKRLYRHKLIFYSAWNRKIEKNSLYSLITENPFMYQNPELKNTRIENRVAGFKGTIENFDYDLRFTNKVVKNFALFVNDSADMKRFDVVYDKNTQIINLHVEAGYTFDHKLRFSLRADYYRYELDSFERAWHKPAFKLNWNADYYITPAINVGIDLFAVTNAYARLQDGSAQRIKGAADINLYGSYRFHKNFHVFLELNNIAHMKYQTWYNYQSFGFNALAGIKFSF